jgi:hypothetical protein
MRHLIDLLPSVSRLLKVAALAGISTVVFASASMWLVTGSTSPSVWIAAYDHARRCAVADAALSTDCTATMAKPAVSVQDSPAPMETPSPLSPEPSPEDTSAPSPSPDSNPQDSSQPAPASEPSDSENDDSGDNGDS